MRALVREIDLVGPEQRADEFGNRQASPSRPMTAPGGRTKAAAVLQAARSLGADAAVDGVDDVNIGNVAYVQRVLRSVPGIGYATSSYFAMLLDYPGLKPDRMIHGFVRRALGHALMIGKRPSS